MEGTHFLILDLQIWAVNISDAKGSYRYVGLCKEKDFATLKEQAFYNQELILNDYNLYSHIPITNYFTVSNR